MERIGKLWESLPSDDALSDLADTVVGISQALATIPELWESLPDADELEYLETATGAIAANLSAATE